MIKQISIFAENTKGAMRNITKVLAEHDINLIALVTNDSAEFGIVRMLVSDSEKAFDALKEAGYMVHTDTVVAAEIGDAPGSLDRLLQEVTDSNINVDYLYMSYDRNAATPIAVMKVDSSYEVAECLSSRGYTILE